MGRRRLLALALVLLSGGAVASLAFAGDVDLSATARLKMTHAIAGNGPSDVPPDVTPIGDFNGDGHPDFAVGMGGLPGSGNVTSAGQVFVITSLPSGSSLDLGALGASGFTIFGASSFAHLGQSVAPVGDVNGDGYADILVGEPGNDDGGGANGGAAYVIFGGPAPTDVTVTSLGTRGYEIEDPSASDTFGTSVSGLGDLNGDGIPDFVIGAPGHAGGAAHSGAAFVVWGKHDTTTETLGASTGYTIDGGSFGDELGTSVAGVHNASGTPDILAGAPGKSSDSGVTYLLHGKTSNTAQNADTDKALTIAGTVNNGSEGEAVADLGAVGGHEMIATVAGADSFASRSHAGTVSVVRADATGSLTDTTLGANGYVVGGDMASDGLDAVSSAGGDVTGDGVPDLLVGVYQDGTNQAGAVYVVPGQAGPAYADVDLASPPAGSSALRGGTGGISQIGGTVAGAGDIDGDGHPDLLVAEQRRFVAFLYTGSLGGGGSTTTTTTSTEPPATATTTPDSTTSPAPPPPATTTTATTPKPAPAPVVSAAKVILLPSAHVCASRRDFKIHLKVPKTITVTSASVIVNKQKAKTFKGKKLTSVIDLRGLPKGTFTVKITLALKVGTSLKSSRTYHTCAPKKR